MAFKKLKYWFDKDLAEMLSDKILQIKPGFDRASFVRSVDEGVAELELKDRVELIADELKNHLNLAYGDSLDLMKSILGPENEEETAMFTNFYWIMPVAKYVEKYGLEEWEVSMDMIEEVTKRNTGEYTIRPFIEQYPERTLDKMRMWSKDSNRHVRRLACEGLRPRLPWAKKLEAYIEDPSPLRDVLENLKDDPSKYVQKSVANCINDILKDNPDYGQKLIEDWNVDGIGKERKWIIKHALRNLLKKKDPWAEKIVAS